LTRDAAAHGRTVAQSVRYMLRSIVGADIHAVAMPTASRCAGADMPSKVGSIPIS
jgi:hypothetical protein